MIVYLSNISVSPDNENLSGGLRDTQILVLIVSPSLSNDGLLRCSMDIWAKPLIC